MAVAEEQLPLRRRISRLSSLTVGLVVMTLATLVLAGWVALRAEPEDIVGQLPLGADDNVPSLSLFLAAGAAAAGVFMGLAALHVAAVVRVLARDRRIPPPLSREMRMVRRAVLTPLGPAAVRLVSEPEPPPSKLPAATDATQGPVAPHGARPGAR